MMKSIHTKWFVLISSFMLIANAGLLQAETNMTDHQHSQGHNKPAASELNLDHGKKWKTDEPLRRGMYSINHAVMNAVPAYHHKKLTKSDTEKLARYINDQVNFLVANCKLEPAADATLHVLIGDLLTAAATAANEPLSPRGLPHLIKTLELYPEYFEHQNWGKHTEK